MELPRIQSDIDDLSERRFSRWVDLVFAAEAKVDGPGYYTQAGTAMLTFAVSDELLDSPEIFAAALPGIEKTAREIAAEAAATHQRTGAYRILVRVGVPVPVALAAEG